MRLEAAEPPAEGWTAVAVRPDQGAASAAGPSE